MIDLSIDRGAILAALRRVIPALDGDKTLTDITLTARALARGAELTITACGRDSYAIATETATVAGEGTAVVHAATLLADLKAIPDAAPRLQVTERHGAQYLHVIGANDERKAKLPVDTEKTMAPPAPPMAAHVWTCNALALAEAIGRVQYAIGEPVRFGINGLHVEQVEGQREVRLVATDGHRLALAVVEHGGDFEMPERALLSRAACKGLAALTGGAEVRLKAGAGWLHVEHGSDRYGWLLIDGEFPDYNAVIFNPESARYRITVRRDVLAGRARAASRMVDQAKPMRLEARDATLTLSLAVGGERETTSTMPCEYEGWPDIGINPAYLADALERLASDEVSLSWASPLAPVRIEAADAGDGTLFVVMPMRMD